MNPSSRKIIIIYVVLIAAILFITGSALGIDNIQDLNTAMNQPQPEIQPHNLWISILKLVLVLGIIVFAAWSTIRLFSKQVNSKIQGTWLHVVDEVMLGQNRGVVLCEIDRKLYALGVTEGQINLLFEVNNPGLLEEISKGDYVLRDKKEEPFINSLTGLINRLKTKRNSTSPREFHLLMQEQARRVKRDPFSAARKQETSIKRSGEDE